VTQRGIVGRLSPETFAVSQSKSTFFHSAGESNDARRQLNFADRNVVFSAAKLARSNETYSPVNRASSNEMFLRRTCHPRTRCAGPELRPGEGGVGLERDVLGAEVGALE
jgi:hypothetical protein